MFVTYKSHAQLPLSSILNLALQNSPEVKMAQDDVRRSSSFHDEMKDAYIPSVVANGGAGSSYGITLSVPTIFTINAQSLVYSSAQRQYVRGARVALAASTLALADARAQVEEDAAVTYVLLCYRQAMMETLSEEYKVAQRLQAVMQQRSDSGMESPLEVQQARRTALQIKLNMLESDGETSRLREHLGKLVGLSGTALILPTHSDDLPKMGVAATIKTDLSLPDSPAVLSAEANALSKQIRAAGDSRYNWRPQISFFAQYGRVSPINNVSDYYNLHGRYNTAAFGLQVQLPLLDATHNARARESGMEAMRSVHEADRLRRHEAEDRLVLLHSFDELQTRVELAEVDQTIAQQQLDATILQLKTGGYSGRPLTPKDELDARLQERQKYLSFLEARLQLQKTQIFIMRQTNSLDDLLYPGNPPK